MVEDDVLRLNDMSVNELQELWRKYFDSEPIWKNKRFYILKLAYRMQELAYGGLPNNIRTLLLAKQVQKRIKLQHNNLPPVGTRMIRNYRGKKYNVIVTNSGFQFEGIFYKSLSAIAFKITGKKISGNYFFNIGSKQ